MAQAQITAQPGQQDGVLKRVASMIEYYIETDPIEPEILRDLENLVKVIKERPEDAVKVIQKQIDEAIEQYLDKLICPACGCRLYVYVYEYGYRTLKCGSCGEEY